MELLRKYLKAAIAGGVALVLLIAALVLLWQARQSHLKVDSELTGQMQRITALKNGRPYPSAENLQMAQDNLVRMQVFVTNWVVALRANQVAPQPLESAAFARLLENVAGGLRVKAQSSNVALPVQFAFGFDRYLNVGDLPLKNDIPRLYVQLYEIKDIAEVLFAARVSELVDIRRAAFDDQSGAVEMTDDAARTGRRGQRAPDASAGNALLTSLAQPPARPGLYDAESFILKFRAREAAVREVLRQLAQHNLFIVVSVLDLASPLPVAVAPRSAADGAAADPGLAATATPTPAPALNRDERVMAGRELVTVTMRCDVYRFPEESVPQPGEAVQ